MNKRRELFVRYRGNPILTPDMWSSYPVESVCNPAAVKHKGKTLLLVRAVDRRNYSHLSLVSSPDGKNDWKINSSPTLEADSQFGEHSKGLEDPRIVWIEEMQEFIIALVSFRMTYKDCPHGIELIGTKDFLKFRRISKPLESENKNPSLFPRRIGGLFALIHRPTIKGKSYVSVAFSDDLIFWGREKPLFSTREWGWDNNKVGLGCPPIETEEGWLLIYHGFGGKANKFIYRVGLALLDLEDLHLTRRSEEWVLGPEELCDGGDDGIVFPCGYTLNEKTKELRVYYGTNDSSISLATANLDEVLAYLMTCPVR